MSSNSPKPARTKPRVDINKPREAEPQDAPPTTTVDLTPTLETRYVMGYNDAGLPYFKGTDQILHTTTYDRASGLYTQSTERDPAAVPEGARRTTSTVNEDAAGPIATG